MGLRIGSVRLALCAMLIGTASALALAPHDKAVGVQTEQKADGAVHAETQAQSDKASSAPTPPLVPPAQPAGQQGDAGQHGEGREQEGTEFWPTFLGYKFKITDSLIALSTLALTAFTGLLWRSTEKLWTAGERQIGLVQTNSADQARDTQESLRISSESARASTASAQTAAESAELTRQALILAQRPRIRVGNIWAINPTDPPTFTTHNTIGGQFDFENVGNMPANIINADVYVYSSERGLPYRYPLGTRRNPVPRYNPMNVLEAGRLAPGEMDSGVFTGAGYHNFTQVQVDRLNTGQAAAHLYVMGWIEFSDDARIIRRTRFCREYNFVARRFLPVADPDYEYEA